MNIASLRRKINESSIGRNLNDSALGLMFEGVIRAYSLDEFINMISYGSSKDTESPKVTAEYRVREGRDVDTYSTRFITHTSDGRVVVYDEEFAKYRRSHHPQVTSSTFGKRTEAPSRAFVTIETRLKEIRERVPGIRTEVVNLKGFKLEGSVYEIIISSAIRDGVKPY